MTKQYSELTKEEAIQLLEQGINGENMLVVHPRLLERLVELGVEFTVTEGETLEEFFERAKHHAEESISTIPPMPNWLEYQFRRPYYESRCCLLVGLYGAAITTAAILLERVLKWTAFCVETRESTEFVKDRWEEIEEKMQFAGAVGYAKRWGLVDKKLSKRLDRFREDVRNTQSHLKIQGATKDDEFHKANVVNVSSKSVETNRIVPANENPVLAAIAKEKRDQEIAVEVFLFVHECIEHLFAGMEARA